MWLGSGDNTRYGLLALFLLIGVVLGGLIGQILSTSSVTAGIAPYLVQTVPFFELPSTTLNLNVVKLTVGFSIYPNLISILGMIAAIILFRRF